MGPNINRVTKIVGWARPNWPKLTKYIGGGVNGRVFETNNGRYLKVVTNNASKEWQTLARLQGSFLFPRFAKGNHIRVPILPGQKKDYARILNIRENRIHSTLSMFIMGRVGNGEAMTLAKYLRTFPKADASRVQDRVFGLIEAMHEKGVSHGDLHSDNILVRPDAQGRILGMWAIDFGRARNIPLGKTERQIYAGNKNNRKFWTPRASNRPNAPHGLHAVEYDKYFALFPQVSKRRVNEVARRLISRLPSENLNTSKIYLMCTNQGVVLQVKTVRGGNVAVGGSVGSRANTAMAKIHYGRKFPGPRENAIRNRRLEVAEEMKNYKSPRKVTSPTRRTKSASRAS
jgi:serine/threonine protein kinase